MGYRIKGKHRHRMAQSRVLASTLTLNIKQREMIMAQEKTVNVGDFRGADKQVTREDFVNQWMYHGRQISNLNLDFWLKIKEEFEGTAGAEWDRLYEVQNKS